MDEPFSTGSHQQVSTIESASLSLRGIGATELIEALSAFRISSITLSGDNPLKLVSMIPLGVIEVMQSHSLKHSTRKCATRGGLQKPEIAVRSKYVPPTLCSPKFTSTLSHTLASFSESFSPTSQM